MIDAASVPEHFHLVHLDLAREPDYPEGSARDRYTLLLPLDGDGRILEEEAKAHPDYCRVSRLAHDGSIERGMLRREADEAWALDFGRPQEAPEVGFRFAGERFTPGEYVSILRDGEEHTYRVVSLQPL